ncbi:MAG TPA: MBOAT family protein [Candidatus Solibacter sp.]|nr:MBOAT family protein [Candidatus Solibacter sp.]
MTALTRLLIASLGGIYLLKSFTLATRRPITATGLAAFLLAWPGVISDHFRRRANALPIDAARFFAAWSRTLFGGACIFLLAAFANTIPEPLLGLAGVAALLLTLHLGAGDLLPWLLRWAGFPAPLLFDRPWTSTTLADFWSRRWNLAFVEMNRRLFLRPLWHTLGGPGARFALFIVSGILHELALSWPAAAGWGLPLAYFALQGTIVAIEERFRIVSRAWTLFWLIAPAPWLFHEPFRRTLIIPFYRALHTLLTAHSNSWYLSSALYTAALAHLIILIASAQVPTRLNWRHDLRKLAPFNRKIFWTYGAYIVLCIASFAALTWFLHDDLLAGARSARFLAAFIAIFWTARVAIDVFWFDYRDWPPGNALIAGHALLTTLFAALAAIYWCAALIPSTIEA